MLDQISQYVIMIFGPLAVWIVGWKNKYRRWGYIFGLASQPFWFYTLIVNEQYPIMVAGAVYTFGWCVGIWNYWVKDGTITEGE